MVGNLFRNKFFLILIFLSLIVGGFLTYKNDTMPKIEEPLPVEEFQTSKEEVLIGVISDTHIPTRTKILPKEIEKIFKNVDLILHAGDMENLETLEELKKIAPVMAVEGNMDFPETKTKLPPAISLRIYNWKIGLIHSPISSWPDSHFNWRQEKTAKELAEKEGFDIVIFGHTHRIDLTELKIEGKKALLINPGSPTFPLLAKPSVGLLRISRDSFQGEIIYLK